MCGVCSTSRSTSVVFPAPEGADTMNSRPRRPGPVEGLLDILDLLAHLLELRLRRDHELRHAEAVGFRPHRVHLAVHLLEQKIELAPARLRRGGERDPVRHVAAKALD